ncbi:hypothetical protein SAMN05660642_00935 [Geodermatophilus siccatus]|uniref:Uncharacterized protein n=1 Tax=Geodermatophilus siccatus TaxID=1137991 RepID=A0A1G9N8B4_9ACTN|nr:hypothetical protein SAMN05660642_00935 [Geodermatophilus siccatus]
MVPRGRARVRLRVAPPAARTWPRGSVRPSPALVVAAPGHRRPDPLRGARRRRTQSSDTPVLCLDGPWCPRIGSPPVAWSEPGSGSSSHRGGRLSPYVHLRVRSVRLRPPTGHLDAGHGGNPRRCRTFHRRNPRRRAGSGRVLDEHAARDRDQRTADGRGRHGDRVGLLLGPGHERPGPCRERAPVGRGRRGLEPLRRGPAHRRRGPRRSAAPGLARTPANPRRPCGPSAGRWSGTPRLGSSGVGPVQEAGLGALSSRTASRVRGSSPLPAVALARCRHVVSARSV